MDHKRENTKCVSADEQSTFWIVGVYLMVWINPLETIRTGMLTLQAAAPDVSRAIENCKTLHQAQTVYLLGDVEFVQLLIPFHIGESVSEVSWHQGAHWSREDTIDLHWSRFPLILGHRLVNARLLFHVLDHLGQCILEMQHAILHGHHVGTHGKCFHKPIMVCPQIPLFFLCLHVWQMHGLGVWNPVGRLWLGLDLGCGTETHRQLAGHYLSLGWRCNTNWCLALLVLFYFQRDVPNQ